MPACVSWLPAVPPGMACPVWLLLWQWATASIVSCELAAGDCQCATMLQHQTPLCTGTGWAYAKVAGMVPVRLHAHTASAKGDADQREPAGQDPSRLHACCC